MPSSPDKARRAWILSSLLLAFACSESTKGTVVEDGGRFEIPDSGWTFDGSVPVDATVRPDAGPYVCDPECTAPRFCGCLDTFPAECGCHLPQGPASPCDPNVAETCEPGLQCVEALKYDRYVHVCSDGTEGTPCSRRELSCQTTNGCVCANLVPFGMSCACQGAPKAGGLCDPNVAGSCPDGAACVPVGPDNDPVWYCSDGRPGSPCKPGTHEAHCETSLGCNCPIYKGEVLCVCKNPSTTGQLCDPSVTGACIPDLECRAVQDGDTPDLISTRCTGGGGGLPCDPLNPGSCPPGSSCVSTGPGQYQCEGGSTPDAGTGGGAQCNPTLQNCPQGYQCRESQSVPGLYFCEPIGVSPDSGTGGGPGGSGTPCDPLQPLCPVGEYCVQNPPGSGIYSCHTPN